MKISSKYVLGLLVCFLFTLASIAQAQTIYKKDPGIFVLGLRSYHKDITYLSIGPSVGYRFGKRFDVRLHPQLLFVNRSRSRGKHFSVLNLGFIGGYTAKLSDRWQVRAQLSFYKIIQFDGDRYMDSFHVGSPLNSGVASFSFYYKIPISKAIAFYPNAGMLFGYGANTDSYVYRRNHHFYRLGTPPLDNAYQGFVSGGKLGFDVLFKVSPNFYLTVSPHIRLLQQTHSGKNESIDTGINIGINF